MVEKCTPSKALELLMENTMQNRYPILRIKQGGVKECWIYGNSVCVYDYMHNKYCYTVRSDRDLRIIYDEIKHRGGELISLVTEERYIPTIRLLSKEILINICVQFCSVPYDALPLKIDGVQFRNVTEEFAKWMLTVYEHPELTIPFILHRATVAPAVAAFHHNEPVGFFITHSDAELGPIYVVPKFRGSGLAQALYAEIARSVNWEELSPVLFTLSKNHASQKLLSRIGCLRASQLVAWFWRGLD